MKFFEALKKVAMFRFYAGLLIVGLLFSVISLIVIVSPKAETATADAVIQQIEEREEFVGEDLTTTYTLYISYTDRDGGRHENIEYNGYSTGMEVGDTVTIEYDVNSPENIGTPNSGFIPYVFCAIGIVCIVVSVLMIKKAIQSNRADPETKQVAIDPAAVEAVRNSTEPTRDYYFHFTGKLNQSYILETPEREPVYEGICDKMGVASPSVYTFKNHLNGDKVTCKVGHTLTKRYGQSEGNWSFSVPTSSAFNINDVDNWEYLEQLGYTLNQQLKGVKLCFDLCRYGIPVGRIETAGSNILKDGATSKLGNIPTNGLFTVNCRESDAEGAFFACFSASRVEFF